MRISDWSSDVCSSDLEAGGVPARAPRLVCCWALSGRDLVKKSLGIIGLFGANRGELVYARNMFEELRDALENVVVTAQPDAVAELHRSEEHTSELQSLMRISYAVFCLNKKTNTKI